MLRVDVPNTVTELLEAVTPHFQERLQDEFQQQGLRRQRVHPNHKTSLKNVIVLDEGTNIELSNLEIIETGQCTLRSFHVNLKMFNVFLEANMKHLVIEGDYKQSCLNTLVPMSRSGKIVFNLEDLVIDGNIGIYNVEDSFVAKNYDVNMKLGKLYTKVICKSGSNNEVFESTDTDIGKTLLKYISVQVINLFLIEEIIYYQFSAEIVEISASELLLDEPEEVISLSSERILKANERMDSVLNSLNAALTASNNTVLETPVLSFCIDNKKSRIICNTGIGRLENLSFKRIEDISFYECENIQYVYGYIRLMDFQFKYPSFTVKNETGDTGSIGVGAYRNKIFIRLSIQKINDSFKMAVDKVQAIKILDIDFNTNNLDRIGGYFGQLQHYVLGTIYGTVFPLLEEMLQRELTQAIAK